MNQSTDGELHNESNIYTRVGSICFLIACEAIDF